MTEFGDHHSLYYDQWLMSELEVTVIIINSQVNYDFYNELKLFMSKSYYYKPSSVHGMPVSESRNRRIHLKQRKLRHNSFDLACTIVAKLTINGES